MNEFKEGYIKSCVSFGQKFLMAPRNPLNILEKIAGGDGQL
jgi:hypothetical protein